MGKSSQIKRICKSYNSNPTWPIVKKKIKKKIHNLTHQLQNTNST